MHNRTMIGATALTICLVAICLMVNGPCMAAGAVAVGQPADIAQDGVAIYTLVNSATTESAKDAALEGCKSLPSASGTSRSLCKIAATFENQCVAESIDPVSGTPGFGWAMATDSNTAREQALSNCRDTAGPTRQNACVVESRALWCDGSAR
jgi:hypothetical protein